METTNPVKIFDAVKMMRDIRNKISIETANMTFEEFKKYVEVRLKNSGMKPIGK